MTTVVRWTPKTYRAANTIRYNDTPYPQVAPVDIVAFDDHFVLTANIPGLDVEQINIRIDGDDLFIEGEVPQPVTENGSQGRLLLQERPYGQFQRRVRLPEDIDREAIDATYVDGILTLNLPKREVALPKAIKVQVNNNGA